MNIKQIPYWVRGGLLGIVFSLAVPVTLYSVTSLAGGSILLSNGFLGEIVEWVTGISIIIFAPFILVSLYFSYGTDVPWILSTIIPFLLGWVIWFIIGSLVSLIIQKIKSRKGKRA